MNSEALCRALLHAETEKDVLRILGRNALLAEKYWRPLGAMENNFGIVANQQEDPTGAFVEKIINALDANLMASCFTRGIDPESKEAPQSMAEAVEQFFAVPGGRLGDLTPKEQTALAIRTTQVVAVGLRDDPCYLIVDMGEGQTPANFPNTFLSLAKSNKLRIPFVQGKFNAGGTGVLQFCGEENLQLIISRRHPKAPAPKNDTTRDDWGFSVVRRLEPKSGESRRSSIYVYLAPDGRVPSFRASSIRVLPGDSAKNRPAEAYAKQLQWGTVIKLYSYRWKAGSIATTDARYELEKYLHSPCLPFRVIETRDYKANYYGTTVAGVWATVGQDDEGSPKLEDGFPASATLNLKSVGPLRYRIAVFKPDANLRRIPHGVFFTVNGQVHGQLPSDFVRRKLEFEYLPGLLVSVDCTQMKNRVREDFFMASRDRLRQNRTYDEVVAQLQTDLRNHPGLRALNQARRAQALDKALSEEEDVTKTFNELLSNDPSLMTLFNMGERLVTKVGPATAETFKGRRFPTYFRLADNPKTRLIKPCPLNRSCRIEFQTDAENDYFDRSVQPGEMVVEPADAFEYKHLWNGVCSSRFVPLPGAKAGDRILIKMTVGDPDRSSRGKSPFDSEFELLIGEPKENVIPPSGSIKPKKPETDSKKEAPRLAMPNVTPVRADDWKSYTPPFTEDESLRVIRDGQGGFDFYLNVDSKHLVSQLRSAKEEKDLLVHWFKWGLTLSALGMLLGFGEIGLNKNGQHRETVHMKDDPVDVVNRSANGVAAVIIPIVRNLHRGVGIKA